MKKHTSPTHFELAAVLAAAAVTLALFALLLAFSGCTFLARTYCHLVGTTDMDPPSASQVSNTNFSPVPPASPERGLNP